MQHPLQVWPGLHQTDQLSIETRVKKHHQHIQLGCCDSLAVAVHIFNHDHEIQHEDTEILHQTWLHLPAFQVSNCDGTVSQQRGQEGLGQVMEATQRMQEACQRWLKCPCPHSATGPHPSTPPHSLMPPYTPRHFMVPVQPNSPIFLSYHFTCV